MERGIPNAVRQSSTGICFIGTPCCSSLPEHTYKIPSPSIGVISGITGGAGTALHFVFQ